MIRLKEIGIIILLLLFVTCRNQEKAKVSTAIWAYDFEADSMLQINAVSWDTLTYKKLIALINTGYENKTSVEFTRIAHDTIFIDIRNPEYLTQQMGSSGAFEFMATTTFTLTELQGIEFVSFDFPEGDHASPGTYSRKYYWDWIKANRKLNK